MQNEKGFLLSNKVVNQTNLFIVYLSFNHSIVASVSSIESCSIIVATIQISFFTYSIAFFLSSSLLLSKLYNFSFKLYSLFMYISSTQLI
ncbi:MAG: hypothetical protein Q8S84_05735 [bacterium]|nr:hypothetical protein [bacterium]